MVTMYIITTELGREEENGYQVTGGKFPTKRRCPLRHTQIRLKAFYNATSGT